jgi:hypothetical protein
MVSADLGIWLAAAMTIGVYSFMWKPNILGTWAEFMLVGAGMGHLAIFTWARFYNYAASIPKGGVYTFYIIPIILSVLLFSKYWAGRRNRWIERYAIGVLFGVNLGYQVGGIIQLQTVTQMANTLVPLGADMMKNLEIIIMAIIVFSIISHFASTALFGGEPWTTGRKILLTIGRPGRYFIMAAMGAAYCNVFSGRASMVIGRIWFLLHDWLQLA